METNYTTRWFLVLGRPQRLFSHMRHHDLFWIAFWLQFLRWHLTAMTTVVGLYVKGSPMFLPVPFGIDPDRYRFLEIFAYGPYGLIIISAMAYTVMAHGAAHATLQPLTLKKSWELMGFCYFGPWVPTLVIDNLLVDRGLAGPEFSIPWHLFICTLEGALTTLGLMVVFGLPRNRALALGALSAAVFLVLAGIAIR